LTKIGIALAAYKPHPDYFYEQLLSIRNQEYQNWNCIVTLDSPVKDLRKMPKLESFLTDSKFIWIENEVRLGAKKNFEKAIQKVLDLHVDAIACADQDDIWFPNKLAVCLDFYKELPSLSLVHSDMNLLIADKISYETAWKLEKRGVKNSRPRHFIVRNMVAGCSMLFDANLARRFPVIPDGVHYHDHWYPYLAARYGRVVPIPKALYAYRQHGNNELGVTPFKSLLYVPNNSPGILEKCRANWNKSYSFALSVSQTDGPLPFLDRLVFIYPWDFGIGFLILGLINLRKDPAIARACFSRAIGKVLEIPSLIRQQRSVRP